MRLQNWLLFLLVAFLWGSGWPVMKIGLRFVPPTTLVLHRFMLSGIVLSPIFLLSLKKVPKDNRSLGKLLIFSSISVAYIAATHIGLVEESSGIGAVLTYTQPLFVFCLAIPFLKERVTSIRLLGAILGFGGIVILFLGKLGSFTLNSSIIMALGALLWAFAIVYYKKYLSQVDSLIANFFQLSFGVIPLSILSLTTNSFAFPRDIEYVWILLYTSVGVLAIGMTVWLFLIKEEEATLVAGSSFLVPLVALLLGWQFLGETIQIESVFGSALILTGVYLVNMRLTQKKTM
nr:DMT family transporter [Candidatus Njordarchaeum guaymaensis]